MKKTLFMCFLSLSLLCGCIKGETVNRDQNPVEDKETMEAKKETEDMGEKNLAEMDDLQYMMETFGFEEEDLQGLDLEKLMKDYRIRELDYTADEIRQIIDDEGDMYQDDGSTAIYSFLSMEGRILKEDDTIKRIGFYLISNNLVNKLVFDLEEKVYYINDTEPHPMTEEQVQKLGTLAERGEIYEWEPFYKGEDETSTGSYEWKLVFETYEDDHCVYGGFTRDMMGFPDSYWEVSRELLSFK